MGIRRVLFASVLAFTGVSGSALAGDNSAGLILETTGNVPASVVPYSEVAPGADVTIGASTASVVIAHYATCRQVDVEGGTITVSKEGYAVRDGKVLSDTAETCPTNIKINQTTAIAGGLVMR